MASVSVLFVVVVLVVLVLVLVLVFASVGVGDNGVDVDGVGGVDCGVRGSVGIVGICGRGVRGNYVGVGSLGVSGVCWCLR